MSNGEQFAAFVGKRPALSILCEMVHCLNELDKIDADMNMNLLLHDEYKSKRNEQQVQLVRLRKEVKDNFGVPT